MGGLGASYAALAIGLILAAGGQIFIKVGAVRSADALAQFLDPYTILGIAAYGVSAFFYLFAIRRIPMSVAYPTVAINYAVIAVAAHYLWNERIGAMQIGGIALIWIGVLMLHRA